MSDTIFPLSLFLSMSIELFYRSPLSARINSFSFSRFVNQEREKIERQRTSMMERKGEIDFRGQWRAAKNVRSPASKKGSMTGTHKMK